MLQHSFGVDPEFRRGQYVLLESILHEADVYKGFNYLTAEDMEKVGLKDVDPGIAYMNADNWPMTAQEYAVAVEASYCTARQIFPDETRRFYYIHKKLNGKAKGSD